MSSSNAIKINAIEEATYGVTPATGNFKTARFISESLSGTPQTVRSTEIHSDRTSSGQVQVGLDVGGDINTELAADSLQQDFIRAAMMQKVASAAVEITGEAIVVDPIGKTLTFENAPDLVAGDLIILSGFTEEKNNGLAYVKSISGLEVTIGKEMIASETSEITAIVSKAAKISVGTDIVSFSMCKDFTDLTEKSIDYLGMIVNTMSINMQHGAIADAVFGFMGNGYDNSASTVMTDGRTIDPASTVAPFNATSDISGVFIDGEIADFCLQSLKIDLQNGLTPQVCMGRLAPRTYSLGTANVTVSGSAYISDENWYLLEKKLTQEPVSIVYGAQNQDGGLIVAVRGAQLSFVDPGAKGQDQQVSIEFSGAAKTVDSGYFDIYYW
jgi:hypothetical protein